MRAATGHVCAMWLVTPKPSQLVLIMQALVSLAEILPVLDHVMVTVFAQDTKGCGFDSRPFHFQVTTLGKLFTPMCLCQQAV